MNYVLGALVMNLPGVVVRCHLVRLPPEDAVATAAHTWGFIVSPPISSASASLFRLVHRPSTYFSPPNSGMPQDAVGIASACVQSVRRRVFTSGLCRPFQVAGFSSRAVFA